MKAIDPRMERVLSSQLKAVFINALLALILSFGVVFYFWDLSVENFIAACLISFVSNKIFNVITLTYFQRKHYAGNFEEMVKDAEEASEIIKNYDPSEESTEDQIAQVSMTIVEVPEKTYGRYMDVDFYEWLKVKGVDGNPVKVTFTGTISLEKGEIPPPNHIVIPPGLVYQVETV